VLLYAHRSESARHAAAEARLRELAEGAATWGLPVFVIGEFLRVTTHPRVFDPPSTLEEASTAIDALLASPSLRVLAPGDRYWPLLRETLHEAGSRGNLVFDAQIVAVCREHGVGTLLTEDRDFRRFSGIRVARLH
jgi:toxin-antitoxin system PIN domain toxin